MISFTYVDTERHKDMSQSMNTCNQEYPLMQTLLHMTIWPLQRAGSKYRTQSRLHILIKTTFDHLIVLGIEIFERFLDLGQLSCRALPSRLG